MAASLSVSAPQSGSPLNIVDTSTGLPAITSRILQVYNATNALIDTIDMGSSLTAEYVITQDQYLKFTLVLNDGDYTATEPFLSVNFYYNGLISQSLDPCGCGCGKSNFDVAKAMMSEKAAVFYFDNGVAINADTAIKAADAYILE